VGLQPGLVGGEHGLKGLGVLHVFVLLNGRREGKSNTLQINTT
jgi:hypothetical protein